jgi:hypothetical protein
VPAFERCPNAYLLRRTKQLTRRHNRRTIPQEGRLRENKKLLRRHIFATGECELIGSDMHQARAVRLASAAPGGTEQRCLERF